MYGLGLPPQPVPAMSSVRRILFPTDLSESSGWAYAYAARLAARFNAELYALHIRLSAASGRSEASLPTGETDEFCLPLVEGLTETVAEVDAASAPRAIVRYAKEHDVDLIVMGARGRSGRDLPELGHVAEAVVRHAPCPVLMVRTPMTPEGPRRVLVPVDFSERCRTAVTQAKWVAAWFGAQLDLLHVVSKRDAGTAPDRGARVPNRAEKVQARLFRFAVAAAGPEVVMVAHVAEGTPATQIVDHARRLHTDLVVIGTQGETRRRRGEMGSVAEEVVLTAPCPVLAVNGPVQKAPAESTSAARSFSVAG